MDEDIQAPAIPIEKASFESVASSDNTVTQVEGDSTGVRGSCGETSKNSPEQPNRGGTIFSEQVNKVADSLEPAALAGNDSENKG